MKFSNVVRKPVRRVPHQTVDGHHFAHGNDPPGRIRPANDIKEKRPVDGFHSAPVVRLADAKAMELGIAIAADARWRLFAFCPDEYPAVEDSALVRLCRFLADDPASPVSRYTRDGEDIDSVIDVRVVFQQGTRDLALEKLPAFLKPAKGRLGLIDYEKMFCPDTKTSLDIFDLRSIDRKNGCLVIVRPDQYVAHVLPFDAHHETAEFFAGFMLPVDVPLKLS